MNPAVASSLTLDHNHLRLCPEDSCIEYCPFTNRSIQNGYVRYIEIVKPGNDGRVYLEKFDSVHLSQGCVIRIDSLGVSRPLVDLDLESNNDGIFEQSVSAANTSAIVGPGYGSFSGKVLFSSSEPAIGEPLSIYGSGGSLWKSLVTDNSGFYEVDSIPNGSYTIAVQSPQGFESDSLIKHFVVNHLPVTVSFTLTKVADVVKAQLLPSGWSSSWTNSSTGTVRCYIGNAPMG